MTSHERAQSVTSSITYRGYTRVRVTSLRWAIHVGDVCSRYCELCGLVVPSGEACCIHVLLMCTTSIGKVVVVDGVSCVRNCPLRSVPSPTSHSLYKYYSSPQQTVYTTIPIPFHHSVYTTSITPHNISHECHSLYVYISYTH